MKLAAPWNGFRYQLVEATRVIASAKRSSRMHAFDASRPLYRHPLSESDLDVPGRTMKLTPLDRYGTTYGRRVKIYALTRAGRRQLQEEEAQWQRAANIVDRFLKISGNPS